MSARIDEQGRPEPPANGDEWDTLTGFLDYQRATLAWKTAGLDAEQLRQALCPTTMTLGGLLKHMALVEDVWFHRYLRNAPRHEPWASVDWKATPDWDWESASDDRPEDLRGLWQQATERSREAAAAAYEAGGLDHRAARAWPDGQAPSLRWIFTHMIEEYARHNGHADLLREAVDGGVGE
ncbi:MAG TPA: DinB family protein [Mycobacteriales bacterium]|nr:DinB family protein [Mycobacteriales bacterium]